MTHDRTTTKDASLSVAWHPRHNSYGQWMLCLVVVVSMLGRAQSLTAQTDTPTSEDHGSKKSSDDSAEQFEEATFGSGCFWCAEAVFQELKGVKSVVSGYSGGRMKNPTYEDVGTGTTGHAEVIHVTFDPKVISYDDLLEVFWKTHDPTTKNRQGPDWGTQYRSVIFYHDETQKKLAEEHKKKLKKANTFKKPIVTEIAEFKNFYPAEDYHQNYFRTHPDQPYCTSIIQHKVDKARVQFKDKIIK